MQTLSLCMIVRDEAAALPTFLERVAGLWDELCVVDTGSVDNTIDVVRAAGGRLQKYLWNDDFSAARNVSLEMASGDWIIVLDADEWIDAPLKASARALLDQSVVGAALLSFADAAGSREMVRSQKLRMFRRSPGLAYRYRLHEDIWGPVTANLIKTQQHMGRLDGHITHLASSPVRQADKDICRRDAALWRRMLADDPGDLHALCEQVIHALRWETPEAAAAVGRAVLGILAAMPAGQLRADLRAERAIVAIADSIRPLNAQAALGLLEGWEGRIVGGAYFFVRRAELRAACAQASAAAADFAKSLALARGHVQASFACVRPLVGMARLYGQQGDADTAEACIARALQQDPRDPRTLAALADLSLQTEGTGALEAATQRYVGQYGDCQERQAAFAQSQITYDIAQQTVTDTKQDRKR